MAKWAGYAKGPLFENPGDNLTRAANLALTDIAVMGANKVKEQLTPGHGRVTATSEIMSGEALLKAFMPRLMPGKPGTGLILFMRHGWKGLHPGIKQPGLVATICSEMFGTGYPGDQKKWTICLSRHWLRC